MFNYKSNKTEKNFAQIKIFETICKCQMNFPFNKKLLYPYPIFFLLKINHQKIFFS